MVPRKACPNKYPRMFQSNSMPPPFRYAGNQVENYYHSHSHHYFNILFIQTLRFRKHAPLNSLDLNRYSKAIVDVSRLQNKSEITMRTIHRPLDKYCPKALMNITADESFLVVNHYLGTLEQFSFRNDARKADGRRTIDVCKMSSLNVWYIRLLSLIQSFHPISYTVGV